ncbi:MAG: hypothetical protein HC902_02645 [Calothrix sp. SM1_5_4]|nr:hypothetical protein [Calothrix sp. SM1_5_4]
MKQMNAKIVRTVGILLLGFSLMNCSKSKNSSASSTTTSAYVTCPSTGYYTNTLGQNVACTPGTSIYLGTTATTTTTTTTGYTTCPTTGYYVSNGVTYTCTPGTSVYIGGTTTTTTTNSCAQYTAFYGVQYVLVNYNGQYVCMRYDIAYSYQY